MKKIICDRCGADITNNDYFTVDIDSRSSYPTLPVYEQKQFCTECMGKIMDVMEGENK